METTNYDQQQPSLLSSRNKSLDKDQSRISNRKLIRNNTTNLFKKKKEQEAQPTTPREKRFKSNGEIRFLKNNTTLADSPKKQIKRIEKWEEALKKTAPLPTESQQKITTTSPKENSNHELVFNKFSREQKQKIKDYLTFLKEQSFQTPREDAFNYIISKVRTYLQQLQDNNTKLLQINYFFQKQFNQLLSQKQSTKPLQKCNKNNCLECRYHLQKQNKWKQQKKQMHSQLTKLKEELDNHRHSSAPELGQSNNTSIVVETSPKETPLSTISHLEELKQQISRLKNEAQEKDQEYLVLLKEFNYLDNINKDVKNKLAASIEEYKYLSIENRTLLSVKTKLLQKQIEFTRLKNERDQFKKKLIQFHKKQQQGKEREENLCRRCQNKEDPLSKDSSILSISSLSDRNNSSLKEQTPL